MDLRDRKILAYGRFQIIAGVLNGKPRALATQGQRKVLECDGSDVDSAVTGAKAAIDALEEARRGQRSERHIGTVEDYVGAFETIQLGDHERRMLHAHAHAERRTLTATQIAKAAGYGGHYSANSHYGKLGRRVAEAAGLPRIDGEPGEDPWTCALATGEREAGEHWKWTMHAEVYQALKSLNIV